MGPIAAIRLGMFIVGLLLEYGPTLVALGRKIYVKVEELMGSRKTTPNPEKRAELKQQMFRDLVKADGSNTWQKTMGFPANAGAVDVFREKIWERENWGKRREMKMEAIREAGKARKAAARGK